MYDRSALRTLTILAVLSIGTTAYAKDDSPRVHALAQSHPWHASVPSVTTIDVRCDKRTLRYELSIDDRGWKHLVGEGWSAIETPFGRFTKTTGKWKPAKIDTWLEERDDALTIRTLVGAPVLPKTWHLSKVERDGAVVRVTAVDGAQKKRSLSFDTVDQLWTLDGAKVTKTEIVAKRRLPTTLEIGGCNVTRRVKQRTPKMPTRQAIVGG